MSKLDVTNTWGNNIIVSPELPSFPAGEVTTVDKSAWNTALKSNKVAASWVDDGLLTVASHKAPEKKAEKKEGK